MLFLVCIAVIWRPCLHCCDCDCVCVTMRNHSFPKFKWNITLTACTIGIQCSKIASCSVQHFFQVLQTNEKAEEHGNDGKHRADRAISTSFRATVHGLIKCGHQQ